MVEKYKFGLRRRLPSGFLENEKYPELSAIYDYLRNFDGEVFESVRNFESEVLKVFLDFLENQEIPQGMDPLMREGLKVQYAESRMPGFDFPVDYFVYTPASRSAGRCIFGGLERVE